jgi:hypothetical protein
MQSAAVPKWWPFVPVARILTTGARAVSDTGKGSARVSAGYSRKIAVEPHFPQNRGLFRAAALPLHKCNNVSSSRPTNPPNTAAVFALG